MRNVNTADVINQIIDKFKAGIVKENVTQIKITLKPDYLVRMELFRHSLPRKIKKLKK